MIPTPFLDAQMQLDKRKALNVLVLSMTVRLFRVVPFLFKFCGALSPRFWRCVWAFRHVLHPTAECVVLGWVSLCSLV